MYNRKSKVSAVLAIVTAVLLIGLMVLIPFLQYKQSEGDNIGIVLSIIIIFIFGYPLIYVSSFAFAIVALVFGVKMLIQQSCDKLISYNVRMLIATFVLAPFLALGLAIGSGIIFQSTLGLFPIIYIIAIAVAYVACFIAQIVTIIVLRKSS